MRASASQGVARETPVLSSETLGRLSGRPVWLKAENLQRTGSFKIRGAYNRISTLTGRRARRGRRHGERGQPRPGGRLGRARGPGARHRLHAGGRADGEGRGDQELRRRGRARRARLRRRGCGGAGAGRGGGDVRPRLRGPARGRRPGDARPGIGGAARPEVETVVVPIGGGGLAAGHRARARRSCDPSSASSASSRPPARRSPGMAPTGSTIADGIAVKQPGS